MIRARLVLLTLVPSILGVAAPARAQDTPPPGDVVIEGITVDTSSEAWAEYLWQIDHGAPGVRYWSRVAKCETGRDWLDHGTWSGGLGIYNQRRFAQPNSGTWERWGGEQFGLRPQDATPLEQIVVANRIAMFVWRVTYRDWNGNVERVIQKNQWKRPAGFNGWGCIKQHRNGRKKGTWYINLNPTRFERARTAYWRDPVPYRVHEVVLAKMNIPGWAWNKYAHEPWRLR